MREDFALRTALTPKEMGQALTEAEPYLEWIKDLQETALRDVLQGKAIPGWKAVEADQRTSTAIRRRSRAPGGGRVCGHLRAKTLLGLTALEKAVGKKKLNDLAGQYILRRQGSHART